MFAADRSYSLDPKARPAAVDLRDGGRRVPVGHARHPQGGGRQADPCFYQNGSAADGLRGVPRGGPDPPPGAPAGQGEEMKGRDRTEPAPADRDPVAGIVPFGPKGGPVTAANHRPPSHPGWPTRPYNRLGRGPRFPMIRAAVAVRRVAVAGPGDLNSHRLGADDAVSKSAISNHRTTPLPEGMVVRIADRARDDAPRPTCAAARSADRRRRGARSSARRPSLWQPSRL